MFLTIPPACVYVGVFRVCIIPGYCGLGGSFLGARII